MTDIDPNLLLPRPSGGPGPLTGLRVTEIGDEMIDFAGLVLAGLGAEVTKVEPPSGSSSRRLGPFYGDTADIERSLYFWAYNRGKRSVVLDLDARSDMDHFERIVDRSDVLLDSSALPFLSELGVDPSSRPRLVHARLSPFGDSGPWSQFRSSDLVSLALGGVTANCGYDSDESGHFDRPPIAPQVWHSFHIAGQQLVIGVLAALASRHASGRGQKVSVSVHQAVSSNTELDVMNWVMLRQPIRRQTCRHAAPARTPSAIASTIDGRWLVSMNAGGKDAAKLFPFLDSHGVARDHLADQSPRDLVVEQETVAVEGNGVRAVGGSSAASTSGIELVQELTARLRYDELPWQSAQEAGLLWSPIRRAHENLEDTHWKGRGTFADVEHPEVGVTISYPVSCWTSTRGSWTAGRRAPLLGEDQSAVIGELGQPDPRPQPPRAVARPVACPPPQYSALGRPFPLQGIRILDFGWFLASAGATRFLAALGAEVIKVEWKSHPDSGRGALVPVGGDAARRMTTVPLPASKDPLVGGQFNNKNPGKGGLSLNVRDPRGLEIARALIAKCDVVTEGFSPGVLEKWGLDYGHMLEIRPDLIYVKQSGMGTTGSYGRFRTLGPIAAALSGLTDMSGLPDPEPPAGWGYSYLDWFGAYSMATAILAAVHHRHRTGEGQRIDASQSEVGIVLAQLAILDYSANRRVWTRSGNRPPFGRAAPEGIYRCAGEDRWIAITCNSESDWQRLAAAADHPEWTVDDRFATAQSRLAHHAELDSVIETWTVGYDCYSLMERLQQQGIAAGVCQTAEDRCDTDPQLRHLNWLTPLSGSHIGTWPLVSVPIHLSETPAHLGGVRNRAAPVYGEDNEEILRSLLGMSTQEIRNLAASGVI